MKDVESGKLLGTGRIKAKIGAAALALLVVGFLLAPPPEQTTISTPPDRPAPLLEEQVQRRQNLQPFAGVQEVAARMEGLAAAVLGADGVPHGFAVALSPTHLMTHIDALGGAEPVLLWSVDGRTSEATVVTFEPDTGLLLLETSGADRTPIPAAPGEAVAGAMVVAAGRLGDRSLAIPAFVTESGDETYGLGPVGPVLPGMPVYTLDGGLLAIAVPQPDGVRGVPIAPAFNRLMKRATEAQPAALGFSVAPIEEPVRGVPANRGVLVTTVVAGGPADAAGLQVGDAIVAFDDTPVESLEAATQAMADVSAGVPVQLLVVRAGRRQTMEVTPVAAWEVVMLARRERTR